MRGPETRLHRRIKKAILKEYPLSYIKKIHGNQFQHVGIPDLLGCLRIKGKTQVIGFFVGIEVKVPGKGKKSYPTEAQQNNIDDINKAGGIAGCARSPREALTIIRNGLKERLRK